MKNLFLSPLKLFVLICFASCSQEDISYSCNKDIDYWVKDNINKICSMDINEWYNLDDTLKIPVYRAFTPVQRIDFWNERFKRVKSQKWSKRELSHIEKAESFLNSHLHFLSKNRLTDDELDELDIFGYQWMKEGIEQFGWTPQIGNLIIGTGFTVPPKGAKAEEPHDIPVCQCHAKNYLFHSCHLEYSGCHEIECEDNSSFGCGFFLLEECNGMCN